MATTETYTVAWPYIDWGGKEPKQYVAELEAKYDLLINAGFDTGNGFSLGLGKDDQIGFTKLYAHLILKEKKNALPSQIPIADNKRKSRVLTIAQLENVLSAYGDYAITIWGQKVVYEDAINSALTVEDLNNITIVF